MLAWSSGTEVFIRKEGNALFNDALDAFCVRLYGVRHVVKDQIDRERLRKPADATWATLFA